MFSLNMLPKTGLMALLLMLGSATLSAQSSPVIIIEDVTDPIPSTPSHDEVAFPHLEGVEFTLEQGHWTIHANAPVLFTEVLDLQGRRLLLEPRSYRQARLDTGQLPSGVFILRVKTAQGMQTLKWRQP